MSSSRIDQRMGWSSNIDRLNTAALALLCGSLLVGLSGCEVRHHARVRVTAVVERGGVQYSASGVQEFDCRESTHIMNDLPECQSFGEALVVDMKGHSPMFILLRKASDSDGAAEAILGAASSDLYSADNANLPDHWQLGPAELPTIVRFTSLNDPLSVSEVNPQDLSPDFGVGTRFVSFDVQKTDDPITYGVVSKLIPWINNREDPFYLGPKKYSGPISPAAQQLSKYDFVSMGAK